MPAKGKSKVTRQQKEQIALGKAVGKTSAVIAAEVGLRPQTIDVVSRKPEVMTLRQALEAKFTAELEEAYRAAVLSMTRDCTDSEASARQVARTQIREYVSAGEPKGAQEQGAREGSYFLEELLYARKVREVSA